MHPACRGELHEGEHDSEQDRRQQPERDAGEWTLLGGPIGFECDWFQVTTYFGTSGGAT